MAASTFTASVAPCVTNVKNWGSGRSPQGASTITQQVAKNFLLTSEQKLERKLKEAILAIRIEKAYPKDKILELYLNEIYLGLGSYGVAAASLNYFGKELDKLTIEEAAYLAVLPKAPNNYNPFRHKEKATDRRNWIIDQMADNGFITAGAGQGRKGHGPEGQPARLRHPDLCRRLLRRRSPAHAGRPIRRRRTLRQRRAARRSATAASTAACPCAPHSTRECSDSPAAP